MGRHEKNQAKAKHVHACVNLRQQRDRQRLKLIAVVVLAVAVWALYTFVLYPYMPNSKFASGTIYMLVLLAVFLIGLVGNTYATLSTEYNKAKRIYGVTEEQVKDRIKKEQGK